MSTNLNITIDSSGLVSANTLQAAANRQVFIQSVSARIKARIAEAQLRQDRINKGLDPDTGEDLNDYRNKDNLRPDQKPTANRQPSGPFVDIGYYKQGLRDTGALYLQFTKEIFAASGDGLQVINELLNETIPDSLYYPYVETETSSGDWPGSGGPAFFPKPGSGSLTSTLEYEDGRSIVTVATFNNGSTFPDGFGSSCYVLFYSTVTTRRLKSLSDDSAWYALPIKGGDGFILIYHRLQVEQWVNSVESFTQSGTTCAGDDGANLTDVNSLTETSEDPIYLADLYAFKVTAKDCRKITVPSALQEKVNTFPLFVSNNEETDPSAELVSPHTAIYDGQGVLQGGGDVQWWGPNYYEDSQTLGKPSAVKVKTKNGPFPIDVTTTSLDNLELIVVSDWRVPAFCRASLFALGFTSEDLS